MSLPILGQLFGHSNHHLQEVTLHTFKKEVLDSDIPILVDFWGEGCGPCQMLTPLLAKFASHHPEIKVVKVNIGNEPELASYFKVSAIPTLIAFKNKRVVAQTVGLVNEGHLLKFLEVMRAS